MQWCIASCIVSWHLYQDMYSILRTCIVAALYFTKYILHDLQYCINFNKKINTLKTSKNYHLQPSEVVVYNHNICEFQSSTDFFVYVLHTKTWISWISVTPNQSQNQWWIMFFTLYRLHSQNNWKKTVQWFQNIPSVCIPLSALSLLFTVTKCTTN